MHSATAGPSIAALRLIWSSALAVPRMRMLAISMHLRRGSAIRLWAGRRNHRL